MRSRRRLGSCALIIAVVPALGTMSATGTAPAAHAHSIAAGRPAVAALPAIERPPRAFGPGGGLSPSQIRTAYNVTPLLQHGTDGKGESIVIVDSFGSPTIRHDLTAFDAKFHLRAPASLRILQPAGKVPAYHPTGTRIDWATETSLDVEWAHVMAPAARIVLLETPTAEEEGTSGFPQIVKAETFAIRHHLGGVISQSLDATEETFPSKASLMRLRGAYKLAAQRAHRVTVLAASGDNGATNFRADGADLFLRRVVGWPASDPLVTAVGGTQLNLNSSGHRLSPDVAWSDSGGGRSEMFTRPGYQNSVSGLAKGRRGIPDISMDASCSSPVDVFGSFAGFGQHFQQICGTSLATPLFAGIVALAAQRAGHPLGPINPALYRMSAAHDPGIVDVTKGDNTQIFFQGSEDHIVNGFQARAGYDLVTGVGTINAARFVPELARAAG
ncbi:MAG TPA: S53 family peptidase [Streptosporangiaceae bacterium]